MKKYFSLLLTTFFILFLMPSKVLANSIYDEAQIRLNVSEINLFVGQELPSGFSIQTSFSSNYTDSQINDLVISVPREIIWQSSDSQIMSFITNYPYQYSPSGPSFSGTYQDPDNFIPTLKGLKEGDCILSGYSPSLNQTISCDIHVRNASINCKEYAFFTNNMYQFTLEGNTTAASFMSTNPQVAMIDPATGVLTALSKGVTDICCTGHDGRTYVRRINVESQGLNYSNLTTYYYTGLSKGYYSQIPLVANGIQVLSWTSTNPSVLATKPEKNPKVCTLEIYGTGQSTVICTDIFGMQYSCTINVVGGKPWCGLSGGYRLTYDEALKHGYLQDMNKMQDYGDVIYFFVDYNNEIDYQNGYPSVRAREAEIAAEKLLTLRYPNYNISYCGAGDLVQITKGSLFGRIWLGCIYAVPMTQ